MAWFSLSTSTWALAATAITAVSKVVISLFILVSCFKFSIDFAAKLQ
jgi:hypothetical protein